MLKKYVLPLVVVGAALLAISCEENKVVGVLFVTPTSGKRVPQDVVTMKVRWYEVDCVAESVALRVNGVHIGTNTSSPVPETCGFTWDATSVTRGSRPTLTADAVLRLPNRELGLEPPRSRRVNQGTRR